MVGLALAGMLVGRLTAAALAWRIEPNVWMAGLGVTLLSLIDWARSTTPPLAFLCSPPSGITGIEGVGISISLCGIGFEISKLLSISLSITLLAFRWCDLGRELLAPLSASLCDACDAPRPPPPLASPPEPGRSIEAILFRVPPFLSPSASTLARGVLLGLCGFCDGSSSGGAGAGLVGPSEVLTSFADSSTEVHVVAASTGLLINGRAVHPGFKGGRVGAASSKLVVVVVVVVVVVEVVGGGVGLSNEARDGLLFGWIGLMLVLIATVGMVGGGGAGLVGSRLFACFLIGVIVKPLNWPNKLLL